MKINWKNRKAVIIIHQATTGPGHDLRDYFLQKNIDELLFISHPLLYIKDNIKKSSYFQLFKKGKLVKEHKAYHFVFPEYILYLKDMIYSLFWTVKYIGKVDVVFGTGNLNAFAGLLLKWFGVARKSVYYVIDYVPQRFANITVNNMYHYLEKVAAENSDMTWNLSPRMIEAREKKWDRKFPHQIVVPHGVHIDRIKHVPFAEVNKTEIMYMGTLLKKQGIQLVLQAVGKLSKKIKGIHFTIIGSGPYESELKSLTKKLQITKFVTFLGYIESHKEMENRIAQAGIAVALYNRADDEFSYYADPGKIKNYLGAGVPILMTDVPYVARQVAEAKCGFIVEYNEKELTETLLSFFSNKEKMSKYRSNALRFAWQYDWDKVFDFAFQEFTL